MGRPRSVAPLRVAVAGAGFAGTFHAQAWRHVEGAELVAVVDADPERATEVAGRFGGEPAVSVERVLGDDVDVVDICLPTAAHADLALAALAAGKHVLCEKPIALDLDRADEMIAAAGRARATFMAAHVLRFWPEYELLRDLVTDGSLGRLRALTCARLVATPGDAYAPWLLDPRRGLGLAEVAIHDLDIASDLLGRPTAIAAAGTQDATGWSHVQAVLRFAAGATASIEAGWRVPESQPFAASFRAVLDCGIVEYDSRRDPTLRIARDEGVQEVRAGPPEATEGGPWQFDLAGYVAEVREFAACVRGGRSSSDRCPPEAARYALELTFAAFESARSGAEIRLA